MAQGIAAQIFVFHTSYSGGHEDHDTFTLLESMIVLEFPWWTVLELIIILVATEESVVGCIYISSAN